MRTRWDSADCPLVMNMFSSLVPHTPHLIECLAERSERFRESSEHQVGGYAPEIQCQAGRERSRHERIGPHRLGDDEFTAPLCRCHGHHAFYPLTSPLRKDPFFLSYFVLLFFVFVVVVQLCIFFILYSVFTSVFSLPFFQACFIFLMMSYHGDESSTVVCIASPRFQYARCSRSKALARLHMNASNCRSVSLLS